MIDNAFDSLEDAGKAQELSDKISIEKLHRKLDELHGNSARCIKTLTCDTTGA